MCGKTNTQKESEEELGGQRVKFLISKCTISQINRCKKNAAKNNIYNSCLECKSSLL